MLTSSAQQMVKVEGHFGTDFKFDSKTHTPLRVL